MTKRIRTILFFICVFSFLIIAPSLILYSQGYRLDFEKRKIVKTGAFYFKIIPRGAKVFVDGKLKKKTDFFFGSAFIENLFPKKYFVEIQKPEYQSWKKNLEIKEAQVTEAKNIVLIPEKLDLKLLEKEVKDFFYSPDERKIVLKKEILVNEEKGWSLKVYEPEREIKSHLVDEKEISEKEVSLLNLIWSPDSERLILEVEIEEEKKYFLLDLKESPPLLNELDFLEGIEVLSLHPTDPKKLFFTKAKEDTLALFEGDIEKESEEVVLEDVITYEISGGNIFWLSKEGFLQKSDFSGKSQKMNREPIPLKEEGSYQIDILNSKIFLREDEQLFLFDDNSRELKEIGNKIKSLKISADSKKICLQNNFEIWLLFLKAGLGQPEKEAGSKLFLTRFSEKIGQVFWWTSHYLLFNTGSKIKIIEIDDRDEIQIWDLSDFEDPEIYFSQKDKRLYILSRSNLFFSEGQ